MDEMSKNMNEKVRVLNTANGQIQLLRKSLAQHPVFGARLVEVEDEAKPYVEELFKETTPETFAETHPQKVSKKTKVEEEDQVGQAPEIVED